ncbi:hypothetical protein SSOG_08177 [Streptomyces himastatinicus ATCC 53653]|uniref:Uncharacterized protein n=1 Tax=Streptomyces himastatinicus ATCC 53653 TaxID=457427 RepID=D9WUW3_9ACTN|nr:hypothetical protein SSOG_08177 [Streptomyces himastatinicus ATCC 53653]
MIHPGRGRCESGHRITGRSEAPRRAADGTAKTGSHQARCAKDEGERGRRAAGARGHHPGPSAFQKAGGRC